jgi:hypothetical protein
MQAKAYQTGAKAVCNTSPATVADGDQPVIAWVGDLSSQMTGANLKVEAGAKEWRSKAPRLHFLFTAGSCVTSVKVRVDCTMRDVQMIYSVSIPEPERKVALLGSGYEDLSGVGGGRGYVAEENAETSRQDGPGVYRERQAMPRVSIALRASEWRRVIM